MKRWIGSRKLIAYVLGVVLVLSTFLLAVSPALNSVFQQWARHDVEMRARLVFSSVRDYVAAHLADQPNETLTPIFERIAQDERLLAIGLCDQAGTMRFATKLMPASLECRNLARGDTVTYSVSAAGEQRIHVAAFPVQVRDARSHLVLLHDLSYADERATEILGRSAVALAFLLASFLGVSVVAASVFVRRSLRSIRTALDELRAGPTQGPPTRGSLDVEIRSLVRDLQIARSPADAFDVEWSPDTLQKLLGEELPGAEVLVVSNREPYIHNREGDQIVLQRPASGLVSAIEPIMRACGGTWIAHGSGSADGDTVDRKDRVAVPPGNPSYALRRVWLSEEEQEGYYYGLANEGLWPLCHVAFVRPCFRESDWAHYRAINRRFADAVVAEARTPDPLVLVQDYHFALLPQLIRERLPRATIVTFWHIPWPSAETFGIFPWREEVIRGLLGSTILGFHTRYHCNNFLETVDRFHECRIDRDNAAIVHGGAETLVRPYPISIEWPPSAMAAQPPVQECRAAIRDRFGLGPDTRLAVGVERFDYTKGILDRMRAVDVLLSHHAEWRGRFVLLQAAAPTRSKLASYRNLQDEAVALAAEINARHGRDGWVPIILSIRHHEPDEVFQLFRAADLCIVSSLHDGMNLVAKEFVAARDDEAGVLVLSSFAGASKELSEALIVNPFDTRRVAEALHQALVMPLTEQRERMRLMRRLVRQRNVYRWAGQMLLDAASIRRRQSIADAIAGGKPKPTLIAPPRSRSVAGGRG